MIYKNPHSDKFQQTQQVDQNLTKIRNVIDFSNREMYNKRFV